MIKELIRKIEEKKAPICVGLDPVDKFIPEFIKEEAFEKYGYNNKAMSEAILRFNKEIVDKCYDLIPSVKVQVAMYEAYGVDGMKAYEETTRYCKEKGLVVIGDVKRGDIGSTSTAYAIGHLGENVFNGSDGSHREYGFYSDIITVNPYLGSDGVIPFVEACNKYDKGIFVLVKTSNPSSNEFQNLICKEDNNPLYVYVANKVVEWGEMSKDGDCRYNNVGAVVGATYPKEMQELRALMKNTYFLVPGYGAQGGSAKDLRYCFNDDGLGAIINSSRGIIAAYTQDKYKGYKDEEFADASREAVIDMIKDIGMR